MMKIKIKQVAVALLIMLSIMALLMIANAEYEKGVKECVKAGNTKEYCKLELSK